MRLPPVVAASRAGVVAAVAAARVRHAGAVGAALHRRSIVVVAVMRLPPVRVLAGPSAVRAAITAVTITARV